MSLSMSVSVYAFLSFYLVVLSLCLCLSFLCVCLSVYVSLYVSIFVSLSLSLYNPSAFPVSYHSTLLRSTPPISWKQKLQNENDRTRQNEVQTDQLNSTHDHSIHNDNYSALSLTQAHTNTPKQTLKQHTHAHTHTAIFNQNILNEEWRIRVAYAFLTPPIDLLLQCVQVPSIALARVL